MKHSQPKRILSFFLAVLVLLTMTGVGASAWWDYGTPSNYQKGTPIMTVGQSATMLVDMLNEVLAGLGINISNDIIITFELNLNSLDDLARTVPKFLHDFVNKSTAIGGLIDTMGGVGDLGALEQNCRALEDINTYYQSRRGDNAYGYFSNPDGTGYGNSGYRDNDITVLKNLFKFLKDNAATLGKLAGSHKDGTAFNFGCLPAILGYTPYTNAASGTKYTSAGTAGTVGAIVAMPDVGKMLADLQYDFAGYLKGMLLPSLVPGLFPEQDFSNTNWATYSLDGMVSSLIDSLLGPMLKDLIPGVELNLELDLYDTQGNGTYHMLRNTINGLLRDLIPFASSMLAPM
ncbi:MAG: hypothetical protein LBQ33_04265, partial [Oscillospiraceae bacterium]|nr:hypothetical protein [Oscillospiraceae bacterium]